MNSSRVFPSLTRKLKTVAAIAFIMLGPSEQGSWQLSIPASTSKPIRELLNPDGTLTLSSDFSGTLDPTGYRMIMGLNGEPRFVEGSLDLKNAASTSDDTYWDGAFASSAILNNAVITVAVAGTDIYVGGNFTDVGGDTSADYIARWDGSNWHGLGNGLNDNVAAFAVSGTDLYAGGNFTDAGGVANADRIARWNGSNWSALGTGLNNTVLSIAVSGTNVYVGGRFTDAGGNANADRIALWDGSTWNPLGSGLNNDVKVIVVSGSDVYIGGNFTNAYAAYLTRWDGSAWHGVGSGVNNNVYGLAVSGSDVFVAGSFTDVGGDANADRIAHWNGSLWSALGTGLNGTVYSVALMPDGSGGNIVYAGGNFINAGGNSNADLAAYWDGSNWNAMETGLNNIPYSIVVVGSDVYMGGSFTNAGGIPSADYVVRWDGLNWNAVSGNGLNNTVRAIAVTGSDVYVGGTFTNAGADTSADYIARWDGAKWNALGSGLNNSVYALAVSGNNLYVGGDFVDAGGNTNADRIAVWNGSNWNALGTGALSTVNAIAVSGVDVYIAGNFGSAGGVANTVRIARWNGSTWNALGTGLNSTVYALAVSGSDIYAGGNFTDAGGNTTADRIARWNGSTWNALGSALIAGVLTIAVNGTDVYVGGNFVDAGGVSEADYLARWDGSNWNALGTPLNSTVYAVTINGSDVFVGGVFTDAGGDSFADKTAIWDGSSWNAMGSGTDNTVRAIAVSGSNIYEGGAFTLAGGKGCYRFGRWSKPTSAAAITKTFSTPATGVSFYDSDNVTAVSMDVSTSSGGGTVLVNRFEDAPKDSSSMTGNISQYHWIIQQTGLAPSFSADIGFKVSEIPNCGITDPTTVIVYSRPTPGSGSFTALTTTYDETSDRIYANDVASFSEFAFGCTTNPLPVQIVGLSAAAVENAVEIRWSTGTEVDNYGFELQRRMVSGSTFQVSGSRTLNLEPGTWNQIGFVRGSGTSSSPHEYSFTDENLPSGRYAYRIKQINLDGSFVYTDALEVSIGVPLEFSLSQNYPNPFNPTTTIEYELPDDGPVRLMVYDNLGRQVRTLVDAVQPAGYYTVGFNAQGLSSGMYYYRIRAGDFVGVKKLLLLK